MVSNKNRSSTRIAAAAAGLALLGLVTFVGCSSGGGDTPPAPKTTYTGTLYMASEMGGHIAVIPVTIDPSNAAAPFTFGAIGRMQLSTGFGTGNTTHVFHDVRLDGNTLYYSTLFADGTSKAHVGKIDLSTVSCTTPSANPVCTFTKSDSTVDINTGAGMIYCGSGQTATHFVPMTMSYPAYIDAIPKSAIDGTALASGTNFKRTFIDQFRVSDSDYVFSHGVNNPAKTQLYVAVNETTAGHGGDMDFMSGAITSYLLNMTHVVDGAVDPDSVVTSRKISGLQAGGTIAFRSTYTPNGNQILQAGADRLLVLDAASLNPVVNDTAIGGSFTAVENHDVMPTPDGKYAILALRFKGPSDTNQDSGLQLYDLVNRKAIGNPQSTCNGCHTTADAGRLTCGIEGKLTAVTR